MIDRLDVEKIVSTRRIKGEARVVSKTDFSEERYQRGTILLLFQEKRAPIKLVVKSHREHKNFNIPSSRGHPDINDVGGYHDGILKVIEDNLAELAKDKSYYHQAIGATVYDETGSELGKAREILSPGVDDMRVAQWSKKKGLLLPYIRGVVTKVDVGNQWTDVNILEGLIDDESWYISSFSLERLRGQ